MSSWTAETAARASLFMWIRSWQESKNWNSGHWCANTYSSAPCALKNSLFSVLLRRWILRTIGPVLPASWKQLNGTN